MDHQPPGRSLMKSFALDFICSPENDLSRTAVLRMSQVLGTSPGARLSTHVFYYSWDTSLGWYESNSTFSSTLTPIEGITTYHALPSMQMITLTTHSNSWGLRRSLVSPNSFFSNSPACDYFCVHAHTRRKLDSTMTQNVKSLHNMIKSIKRDDS